MREGAGEDFGDTCARRRGGVKTVSYVSDEDFYAVYSLTLKSSRSGLRAVCNL